MSVIWHPYQFIGTGNYSPPVYLLPEPKTLYNVDVLLSQFGTSLFFHVLFYWLLTCIQISQEVGKIVCYSHLLKIFQFVVIHTVKGFSIVNETEVDVFLEFSCFF